MRDFLVTVTKEFTVEADDPREAEAYAVEEEHLHTPVIVEALPVEAKSDGE